MNPITLPDGAQFNVTIQDPELPSVHVALTLHPNALPDEGRRLFLERLSTRIQDAVQELIVDVQEA